MSRRSKIRLEEKHNGIVRCHYLTLILLFVFSWYVSFSAKFYSCPPTLLLLICGSSPSLTLRFLFAYFYPPTPTVKLTLHMLLCSLPPILPFKMCSTLILVVLFQFPHIHSYSLNLVSYSLPSMHCLLIRTMSTAIPVLARTLSCIYVSYS